VPPPAADPPEGDDEPAPEVDAEEQAA
jgi:hypothetical protein